MARSWIVFLVWIGFFSYLSANYPTPPFYAITFANDGVDRVRELSNHPTEVTKLGEGDILTTSDFCTTGPLSYAEVKAYGITLRQGSDTITQWMGDHHWKIIEGSVMFCLEDRMNLTVSS